MCNGDYIQRLKATLPCFPFQKNTKPTFLTLGLFNQLLWAQSMDFIPK